MPNNARCLPGNIDRMVQVNTALHYDMHQEHIQLIMKMLINDAKGVLDSLPDDAILAAYKVEESIDRLAGYILNIHHAADKLIHATPDEVRNSV